MEEEDTRRGHRNNGRFGIHTNKTLKYNRGEMWTRKHENLETLVVIDKDADNSRTMDGRQLLGISINARKNWELIENNNRNSLNSSQDDMDVNYGPHVVVIEEKYIGASRREQYRREIYGDEENEKEPKSEIVNGTNRKGFFVKEKRKKGKKGVLQPQTNNRKRSKSFNNKSESDSDSDSAIDEPVKDNRIIIASTKPKHPNFVRHEDSSGCGCTLCTGKNNKVAKRREIIRDLNDL